MGSHGGTATREIGLKTQLMLKLVGAVDVLDYLMDVGSLDSCNCRCFYSVKLKALRIIKCTLIYGITLKLKLLFFLLFMRLSLGGIFCFSRLQTEILIYELT